MADAQAKFLTGNLFRHVSVMSLTASVGLMAVFLVDFVDMVFISMLGKSELAAAVGYAGAVLFFTTCFGIGMAIAVGALVARALGAGDRALARTRTATGLCFGVFFSVLFAALVWLNLGTAVALLGASGDTADMAVGYLRIVVPSLPLLVIGMMAGAILRAHGDARRAMMATIYGAIVNAVLDPILIFALELELTGAALASVTARVVIAYTSLIPIMRHHGGIPRPDHAGMLRDFPPILAIAVPAILTQLATPVGQAFVTRAMAQFGEGAIAGMAVVGRLTPVAFAIIFALSGAVGPIIGQNFGAKNHDRVRQGFHVAVVFTAVVIVFVSVVLFVLRGPIAALFGADGLMLSLLYLFCGPLALLFFFNGVLFVSNAAFNNLGHPFYSTWMNWGRNTVAMIPAVLIGAHFGGAMGVLIGQAVAGVVFGCIAWALALRVIAAGGSDGAGPTPFARQGRLMTLWHARR